MRIRELEDSEDVAERLAATLATFWGDRGEGVNVLTRDPGDGAPWLRHPMLYGLFHPNLAAPVRRWCWRRFGFAFASAPVQGREV